MVKMVDVRYDGNSFAFPGGELLIEQGNTGKDIMGVVSEPPVPSFPFADGWRRSGKKFHLRTLHTLSRAV
jgi:hypothetical protein